MLSLNQRLSQQQKLSPQQIQYQKLLQLNTLALEQRIKTELELNPILEETLMDELEMSLDQKEEKDSDEAEEVKDADNEEFDVEDYMNDEDFEVTKSNKSPDDENIQPIAPSRISLRELIVEQLHMLPLTEEQMIMGETIISSLDISGYFQQDLEKLVSDLKLFDHVEISLEEAEKVLHCIQNLEPVGIAARSLQECLLIQLRNGSYDPYYSYLAEKVLDQHFEDFANKRFDNIQKNLDLTRETLRATIELIHKLNPKPGEGNIDSEEANQITPDFVIEKLEDNYIVSLNDRSVPSVTISQTYLEMINTNKRKRKISTRDKETHKFLREKFESAKWFIASIQQRRHTLMKIMRAILEKQYEFFEYGAKALKPMIYKDIADEVMMDISTISRVVNGKYVQSPVGIHELKYFFSEGLSTDSGAEVSNKHIRELIKEICDNEPKNKPYSDDKIAKILVDKGIHIARRTVAKYREQLKIPVARLRREL
jgi:RNA polymerase sigma-54 factor